MKRTFLVRAGAALAAGLALCALFFAPTPYVIYKPGLAADVGPMVETADPKVADGSVVMLTTVRQTYPGPAEYLLARVRSDWEVFRKSQIFREGETRRDYLNRQQAIMRSSQSNAIRAAYAAAGIEYRLVHEGVHIVQVIAGMPAHGVLRPGDRLLEIDGRRIEKSEDVFSLLAGKRVGDPVSVAVERDGRRVEEQLTVGDFNQLDRTDGEKRPPRPGLGIQPADLVGIEPEDPKYRVNIRVDGIGGPSAGLMFALEIYDQLTEGDLTRGYRIAGTGEIDPEGNVHAIGGVRHKVTAAHREGADLFFVPEANYEAAKERAEALGTDMMVVKVNSLREALDALARLEAG